jgi:hypothetical protein
MKIVFLNLICCSPLYARVLALTNAHTGFDLRQEGQEHFTIIQYNVADQYTYVANLLMDKLYV